MNTISPALTRIRVSEAPFSLDEEHNWLSCDDESGAVVTFVGKVRNHNQGDDVVALRLEHYPAMTEKALADIVSEARSRWPLHRICVIHRVGDLHCGEQIVFVGVSSAHRDAAFAANIFIMDYLKMRAPFWKKEQTPEGSRWVEAKHSDKEAAARWSDCSAS
ncbi:MAG: molybdopterin synthase catalytic subunit MoaE [Plesiomonas sp.]